MSDVPPEVIREILLQLPVKSLLKFRCVTKSFKSLIDNPEFIKAHLKQQTHKPNSDMKLMLKAHSLFSLDFTSICSGNSTHNPTELVHPLKQPYQPTQILGSCHGLILLSNNLNNNAILWNPSTKVFRKLPVCLINPPSRIPRGRGPGLAQICGGLGYDASDDDYKVVRITQWYHPDDQASLVSEVMVYSLKLDVWKKVQDCIYWLVREGNGTFSGGALNWMATKDPLVRGSSLVLVGFNLGSERFEEMPFPQNLGKPSRLNMTVLGECLCLILGYVTDARNNMLNHVDIRVMKEYGVKESWVKFSIEQLEGRQHFRYLKPISYSVTGKEILLEMDNIKFLWYNLEKKALKHAKISGGMDFFESFVSLGTLVPLNGGGNENTEL